MRNFNSLQLRGHMECSDQTLSYALIAFWGYAPGESVARALPVRLFIVGLYVQASWYAFEGIELATKGLAIPACKELFSWMNLQAANKKHWRASATLGREGWTL